MAAITSAAVTIADIPGMPIQWPGTIKELTLSLTVTAGTGDTYPAGGIPLPTDWWKRSGLGTLLYAYVIGPLTTGVQGEQAILCQVNSAGTALTCFGGATTAAEDVNIEVLPTGAAFTNSLVHVGKIVAVGF